MFRLFSFRRGALSRLAGHSFLRALSLPSGAAVAALRTFSTD